MPSPWVTRAIEGQLPLAVSNAPVTTPHEKFIEHITNDLAAEAAATRVAWQALDERMAEVVASRVEMGLISRSEYDEIMRTWRS